VATVERSSNDGAPPFGGALSYTPVWCEYRPVRMLARDGQHSEVVTNMLLNVIPCAPRR